MRLPNEPHGARSLTPLRFVLAAMTYRNRKLLNLAHDIPCQAQFPHECNDSYGSEPAHADWQIFGRGVGHKCSDWAFAAMCHNAHKMIDPKINPTFDREQRKTEWLLAYVKTQEWLWTNELLRVA